MQGQKNFTYFHMMMINDIKVTPELNPVQYVYIGFFSSPLISIGMMRIKRTILAKHAMQT